MQKRRLVTSRVVGMAMLLMSISTGGIFASDGTSSVGDATKPSAASAAKPGTGADEQINALKQQMALQQQQIEQMQKALAEQRQLLEQLAKPVSATEQAAQPHASSLGEVASTSPMIPPSKKVENAAAPLSAQPMAIRAAGPKDDKGAETSPLQIHIGDATFTPVGFVDFTSVFRNHAAGGSIGTSFASIPYGTTPFGTNLSEFRLSMQNSRIGFRADADVHGAHVMGYAEMDFLGNNPSNVAVSSNSNTMRSRLYWVDLRKGNWEFLGGQTWSLITPGRTGISPLPADLFYTQNIDVNYQAGLVWGRIPELRVVYHPNKQVALAIALDSPDQYAGGSAGGPLITLPALLNTSTTYQGQLDYNGNGLNAPNVFADIIAKLAIDPNKHVHFEIGGIERDFKVYNTLTATKFSKEGGGLFVNLNMEPVKGFRLITNNFYSDGGGRYIFGQSPDLIAQANGNISLIHASSTLDGVEITHGKTVLAGYYGGIYVARNTAYDANGTSLIGYGYSGASSAQNKAIQEITFDLNQTVWKNPKFGALNFMAQYSYLIRSPWNTAVGQPANANNNLLFFNLRYTLPGSAPTLGK